MASAARSSPTQKEINKMTSEVLGKYLEQPTPLKEDQTIRDLEKEIERDAAEKRILQSPEMLAALLLNLKLTNERLSDISKRLIRIRKLKQKLPLSKKTLKEKQELDTILDTEKNQLIEERNKLRKSLERASALASASAQSPARPQASARPSARPQASAPVNIMDMSPTAQGDYVARQAERQTLEDDDWVVLGGKRKTRKTRKSKKSKTHKKRVTRKRK